MNEQRANQLIEEIGQAVVSDPALKGQRWDSLALVAEVEDDFVGMHGYLYSSNKSEPMSPEGDELYDLFPELQKVMAEGEKSAWKACLVTLTKPDFDIQLDFEFEDAGRWSVNPDNIDTLPEQLRPA